MSGLVRGAGGGGMLGPQVNKFEQSLQVSSDNRQVSVEGGRSQV